MPAVDHPRLARFLADPARPAHTLRYHELQGFLFAVASAPEVIPPSEWLPRIFGEAEAGDPTLDHAMLDQIMALYHTITDTVLDPPARLPTGLPATGGRARQLHGRCPDRPVGTGLLPGTPVARRPLGGDGPAGSWTRSSARS